MRYDNLPIYKAALDLCVTTEEIVAKFSRYNRYTIGTDLRNHSKELLFAIHRANTTRDKQSQLEQLRNRCEEFKMLVAIAKELKSLASFKQFEQLAKLSVNVCKQAQAWLNSAGTGRSS